MRFFSNKDAYFIALYSHKKSMFQKLIKQIGDNHFYDALKITISCSLPFIFFDATEHFAMVFTLSLGAMLISPVDIASSLKHKVIGLLSGCFTIGFITLLLGTVAPYSWIFYPVFALIIFASSIIGVYGQRANLLSFTALLSISLAFVHDYQGYDLWMNCFYLFLGGLIYFSVSMLFYLIKPNRYIITDIANCTEQTAKYLDYRAQLWSKNANRDKITEEQLNIQVKLNELHESIREHIIHKKAHNYNTNNNRKLLISLSSLVDMMELTNANLFDHEMILELYKNDASIIEQYQNLAKNLGKTLHHLSYNIKINRKHHSPVSLNRDFKTLKSNFEKYQKEHQLDKHSDAYTIFSNVLHYVEKQIQIIKGLERIYKGRVNADELGGKYKDLEKFLTPQHYSLSVIKENLNFSSTIFRHSIRMTITLVTGYIIGKLLPLQNEYWILMTIVVIMRPGYGLTKQRTKERLLGTVIGGLIALAVLYFIKSTSILVPLTIITMITGYWLSYSHYKVAVTLITIYVIFIYGMLTPDYHNLLIYRVIDTSIAAIIAFAATHLLWPSWEFLKINLQLKESIRQIKEYIQEIQIYYIKKGEPTLAYKLARKHAFIEVGNLMASFQRLIQEPKSKQKNKAELYELAVLNQTLVSATASIGTYVQWHPTSKASEAFSIVMNKVIFNLDQAYKILDNQQIEQTESIATEDFKVSFLQLKKIRTREIDSKVDDVELKQQLIEESQLIIDQLIWMVTLSEKILKISSFIKTKSLPVVRKKYFKQTQSLLKH